MVALARPPGCMCVSRVYVWLDSKLRLNGRPRRHRSNSIARYQDNDSRQNKNCPPNAPFRYTLATSEITQYCYTGTVMPTMESPATLTARVPPDLKRTILPKKHQRPLPRRRPASTWSACTIPTRRLSTRTCRKHWGTERPRSLWTASFVCFREEGGRIALSFAVGVYINIQTSFSCRPLPPTSQGKTHVTVPRTAVAIQPTPLQS